MSNKNHHRYLSETRLCLNREIFDWCLTQSQQSLLLQEFEKSMQWCLTTAGIAAAIGCNQLVSIELEELLLKIAKILPVPVVINKPIHENSCQRWLHVMSKAYVSGGHTALVTRWIKNAPSNERHSLVLTFDENLSVEKLSHAVSGTGGTITALGSAGTFIERANSLRTIAWHEADIVVLHIHMHDVIPTVAFGIKNGPPVMLVNHADHTFWVGASIADRVINIRKSGENFTKLFRGVSRNTQLPIPIPDDQEHSEIFKQTIRSETRTALNIPLSATVLLTIGTGFKYNPIGNIDFLSAILKVFKSTPDIYLVAIGPSSENPLWKNASDLTNCHIIALGQQSDLWKYHQVADIYVEGFPFGSLTALLEAAISGLPCVRAPKICPAPFVSDGISIDIIKAPNDIEAYMSTITHLIQNPIDRNELGIKLQASVKNYHCSDSWLCYLSDVNKNLEKHEIYQLDLIQTLDKKTNDFLVQLLHTINKKDTISLLLESLKLAKLHPNFDFRISKILFSISKEDSDCNINNKNMFLLWILTSLFKVPAQTLLNGKRNKLCIFQNVLTYYYGRFIGWRFQHV
jgi:glycosyltransferase involved in cell wall biosynthesis